MFCKKCFEATIWADRRPARWPSRGQSGLTENGRNRQEWQILHVGPSPSKKHSLSFLHRIESLITGCLWSCKGIFLRFFFGFGRGVDWLGFGGGWLFSGGRVRTAPSGFVKTYRKLPASLDLISNFRGKPRTPSPAPPGPGLRGALRSAPAPLPPQPLRPRAGSRIASASQAATSPARTALSSN